MESDERNMSKKNQKIIAFHSARLLILWGPIPSNSLNTDELRCGWLRGIAVERQSVTGEFSLSYARSAADGWPLMWVNRPLQVSQL